MPTWKVTVEYEGTRYHGWQEQKNARTVAGELRRASIDFLGGPVDVSGAGRTDSGVHALAQVARLRFKKSVRGSDLVRNLNDRLPADIDILKAEEANPNFDPRRDALRRCYLYQISTRRTAFAKRFVWWVRDRLDMQQMLLASQALIGMHDFKIFSEHREGEASTLVRVNQTVLAEDGNLLLFRIEASHFLWKMVRRIVGTLVEVGRGALSADDFAALLEPDGKEKRVFDVARHTAPPSGLFLERVVYLPNETLSDLAPAFPVRKP